MRDEHPARVDGVRVARRPDARSLDDLLDRAQVDVRDHDAAAGCVLRHRDPYVRLRAALERDPPEVRTSGPSVQERLGRGEVDPAPDAIDLERRGTDLLLSACVQVRQLADACIVVEESLEVLLPLSQTCPPFRDRRLCDRVELVDEPRYELLDRERSRRRLVLLDAGHGLLGVVGGEVELGEPDGDHRRGHERHDHCRVLPDQTSVRSCRRFHPVLRGSDRATGRPRSPG